MAKNTKKATKKAAKPLMACVGHTSNAYTTRNGIEGAVRQRSSITFTTGRTESISGLMRWLGFHLGSSGDEGFRWIGAIGSNTTRACAGHQTGSGRNNPTDKKGNPAGRGLHGVVPVLSKEEAAELTAAFSKANPTTRDSKGKAIAPKAE